MAKSKHRRAHKAALQNYRDIHALAEHIKATGTMEEVGENRYRIHPDTVYELPPTASGNYPNLKAGDKLLMTAGTSGEEHQEVVVIDPVKGIVSVPARQGGKTYFAASPAPLRGRSKLLGIDAALPQAEKDVEDLSHKAWAGRLQKCVTDLQADEDREFTAILNQFGGLRRVPVPPEFCSERSYKWNSMGCSVYSETPSIPEDVVPEVKGIPGSILPGVTGPYSGTFRVADTEACGTPLTHEVEVEQDNTTGRGRRAGTSSLVAGGPRAKRLPPMK